MYLVKVIRIRTLEFFIHTEKVARKGQWFKQKGKSVMNLRIILVDGLSVWVLLAKDCSFIVTENCRVSSLQVFHSTSLIGKILTRSSDEIRTCEAELAAMSEVILKICQGETSSGN